MAELKLYKTTTKGLKIIGMSIPFVVIGVWMILQEPTGTTNYIMGWLCASFFGLGIPIGLFQSFDRRPQIIINENGIWDRTTKQDEIKWEQIIDAYPLDIFSQKFISIVSDDTFIFKKKPYKWAAKINKEIGAQNLNLHLGQIIIDQNKLTGLINDLAKAKKKDRNKTIQSFKIDKGGYSRSSLLKILLYISIAITLLLLSLTGFTAFMTIMIVMGISAFTARWQPKNLMIRKYAGIATWFGLINMVLCLGTIKMYDSMTEDVTEQMAIEIEEFQQSNNTFPTDIKPIINNLDLNLFERYFADKIEYSTLANDYELEADMLFGKRKKYDKNNSEWK